MNWLFLAVVGLLAQGGHTHSGQAEHPAIVGRVCGKLVHYEQMPVKNATNVYMPKTRTLKGVVLRLYHAPEDSGRPDGLVVAEEAKTGRWGRFRFKITEPGLFLLTADIGSRSYQMLVRVERKTHEECSDDQYQVEDSGAFSMGRTITVD
jgi:hypothetical protein